MKKEKKNQSGTRGAPESKHHSSTWRTRSLAEISAGQLQDKRGGSWLMMGLILLLATSSPAAVAAAASNTSELISGQPEPGQQQPQQPASVVPADGHSNGFKIVLTLVYLVIFLIGVCGNLCNCLVIADSRNRYMKTATNYYLFSLSISDLLLLTFGLPHDIVNLWHPMPYLFNSFVCISRGWISEASTYASVLVIVAFTVERYLAICHPLKAHTLSRLSRSIKIIIAIWLVASSGALVVVWQFGIQETIMEFELAGDTSQGEVWLQLDGSQPNPTRVTSGQPVRVSRSVAQCTTVALNKRVFELSVIIFFIIPMTLITILYIKLGHRLRQKTTVIKRNRLNRERDLSQQQQRCSQTPELRLIGGASPWSCSQSSSAGQTGGSRHEIGSCHDAQVQSIGGAARSAPAGSSGRARSPSTGAANEAGASRSQALGMLCSCCLLGRSTTDGRAAIKRDCCRPMNETPARDDNVGRLAPGTQINRDEPQEPDGLEPSEGESRRKQGGKLGGLFDVAIERRPRVIELGDAPERPTGDKGRRRHLASDSQPMLHQLEDTTRAEVSLGSNQGDLADDEQIACPPLGQRSPTNCLSGRLQDSARAAGSGRLTAEGLMAKSRSSSSLEAQASGRLAGSDQIHYRHHSQDKTAGRNNKPGGSMRAAVQISWRPALNDSHTKQAAAGESSPQLPASSIQFALNSTVNTSSMKSVIKMLVSVVVMFFVCWAPFHAQRLMAIYVREPTSQQVFVFNLLNHISGISYYISAVANPILYSLFSMRFRQAFRDTFETFWLCPAFVLAACGNSAK